MCVALVYDETSYSCCNLCSQHHIFVSWIYTRHHLGILRNNWSGSGRRLERWEPCFYNQQARVMGQDNVSRNVKMTSFVFWLVEMAAHGLDKYQSGSLTALLIPWGAVCETGSESSLISIYFSSFGIYCIWGENILWDPSPEHWTRDYPEKKSFPGQIMTELKPKTVPLVP